MPVQIIFAPVDDLNYQSVCVCVCVCVCVSVSVAMRSEIDRERDHSHHLLSSRSVHCEPDPTSPFSPLLLADVIDNTRTLPLINLSTHIRRSPASEMWGQRINT